MGIFLLKISGYFHNAREAQDMSIVSCCNVIFNYLSKDNIWDFIIWLTS